MKNKKRKFESIYNKTKQNSNWLKYKQYCYNYTYEFCKTKTNYIYDIIQGSAADPKRMHSIINDLLYGKTSMSYPNKDISILCEKFGIFFNKNIFKIIKI